MRTIGVVTVGRSDYGIHRPVLARIAAHPELEPAVYVGGSHLSPDHGDTVDEIEADGYPIAARVACLPEHDSPLGVVRAIAAATAGFGEALAARRPDLLLVLGDRFEMHAAVVAALPQLIPVAHVHGGESTEGAIDDALRHSITKLSHLHFAATEAYADRIVRMGEEPWRVTVSGAPALDALAGFEPLADEELGLDLSRPPLVVTFHPATLEYARAAEQAAELLAAVAASGLPAVFTAPNADTGRSEVAGLVAEFVARTPTAAFVASLGQRGWFSLLGRAAAMVGNSSSGIVEAASFRLPVVNVGARQGGRLRAANVIDVPPSRDAILAAIRRAVSPEFRARLDGLVNPYGDGRASERIVARLAEVELGERLLVKRFHDGARGA